MATTFLRHEPCNLCGSSDNTSVWWDDELKAETHWCYTEGCPNKRTKRQVQAERSSIPEEGHLPSESWCQKMGIPRELAVTYDLRVKGKKVYFGYRKPSGRLDRIKCRNYDIPKDSLEPSHFFFIGDAKEKSLYGMQTASSKKHLLITTGEWDAIYARKMLGKWWTCVSVDRGDDAAVDTLKSNYDWIRGFESVYLCFDNDPSGQRAVAKCAQLLGDCWTVHLPSYPTANGTTKDAKDYATSGLDEQFKQAVFAASRQLPSFIASDDTLFDEVESFYYDTERTEGYPITAFPQLTEEIGGLRAGEVSLVLGIPGRGKSTFCRQVLASLSKQGIKCLYMSLEEHIGTATTRVLEAITEKKLIGRGTDKLPPTELRRLFDEHIRGKVVVARLAGALALNRFQETIEFAAKALDVKYVLLDHITAATDMSSEQHVEIRRFMSAANVLAQELGVHIQIVSHVKRKQEEEQLLVADEDPVPTIRDAFGSAASEQYAHVFLGLQATASGTKLWVLKNRLWGINKKVIGMYFRGYGFHERGDNGKHTGDEMSSIGRNTARQQIRAGVLQQVQGLHIQESHQVRTGGEETTTEGAESDNNSGELGRRPGEIQVPTDNVEPRLVDNEPAHSGNQGEDGTRLHAEGEAVQVSASRILSKAKTHLPGRKPTHPREQARIVHDVGQEHGNPSDRLEDKPQRTKGLANLLSKYGIEEDD